MRSAHLFFCFIKFFLGEDLESFEQWKKIIVLLTNCDKLIETRPEIFLDFTPVLYYQLQQMPKDFFIDCLSKGNFLHSCLKSYFEIVKEVPNESLPLKKLKIRINKLKELIKVYFIGFEDQETEDDPIIV